MVPRRCGFRSTPTATASAAPQLLRSDADEAADEAIRDGRPVELDPMPASERRIVHEHLRERGGVETYSEGEEPDRYLVVAPLDD